MQTILNHNSSALQKFITIARLMDYKLPGNPATDIYTCGISGGADSSVTGILLKTLFPDTDIRYVFTDTKAEAEGTNQSIEAFEKFTGVSVVRIAHEEGLLGLIDSFNGFLPSSFNRWCTRITKQEPYEDYMEDLRAGREGVTVHSFIGLRADEPSRSGLDSSMAWLSQNYPMRDLGLVRADVFKILEETIGIPSFYMFRTRSGCALCPFMRSSEILGSMARYPAVINKAEGYERLTQEDVKRFTIAGEDLSSVNMAYPVPSDLMLYKHMSDKCEIKGIAKNSKTEKVVIDLFGEVTRIFVGIEFLQDTMIERFSFKDKSYNSSTGCYYHALVGWSSTRGGISRKLNHQFASKLDTAEVFGLSQEEFRQQYKQAVYLVEVPAGTADLKPSSSTDKDLDGRLIDAGGNSLLVDGVPVYFRNKKISKKERSELRKQSIHNPKDFETVNEAGEPVNVAFNDNGLFESNIALNNIKPIKHTVEHQKLTIATGDLLLNGALVYREKKGVVKKTGSFSWRKGEPLAQIRQVSTMIKRTMLIESLRQSQRDYAPFKGTVTWEAEQYEYAVEKLSAVDFEYGSIVGMESYAPSEIRQESSNPMEMPCFACSK